MHDTINFLSKLTLRKLVNALLLCVGYQTSRLLKKPLTWGRPVSLAIEPTARCNLSCPQCPTGERGLKRTIGSMDKALFHQVTEQVRGHLMYLILYFQGEPFLHPDLLNMVRFASDRGIYTATSTNGHFITKENARSIVVSGLDRLIVSLDGVDQKTYEQYRKGGDVHKVIEGIKHLVNQKKQLKSKTPHLIIQSLLFQHNEHQTYALEKLGKSVGADKVVFKTAQIYDFKQGNKLIPLTADYSRYQLKADGTYTIKNKLPNHCFRMWHSMVITWDGMVVPCCFDKHGQHSLGHLNNNSIHDIWTSAPYVNFRKKILLNRKAIDICRNCTEQ